MPGTLKSHARRASRIVWGGLVAAMFSGSAAHAQTDRLITGKRITLPPLGSQVSVGSLPMNMIATPDGKFAVVSDMGFRQKLSVIRAGSGTLVSSLTFGDPGKSPNTVGLYYGLAATSHGDGTSTVYAAQGGTQSIAVLKIDANGNLSQTGTIAGQKGDFPAGLALSPDGRYLYATDNEYYVLGSRDPQDAIKNLVGPGSLVIYDTQVAPGKPIAEVTRLPLGPDNTPSTFPLAVAATANTVYVAGQRDGVIYVVDTTNPAAPSLKTTLSFDGLSPADPAHFSRVHPSGLLLNRAQTKLFVANAHTDTVAVIDTQSNTVTGSISVRPAGAKDIPGATPVGLGLSPDEGTLYAALGDMNAVAVVNLATSQLTGYIPTGWYPTAVVSAPYRHLLIANAKGTVTRNPNPDYTQYLPTPKYPQTNNNHYSLSIIEGNVSYLPLPNSVQLRQETDQVMANNGITPTNGSPLNPLAAISLPSANANKIKHVFYIIKENRTYDQVLGDLTDASGNPLGNGSPALTLFGKNITPNQHALARQFVLLDNFYDCGEASGDGWPWSTQGMANESVIKNLPYNYSNRGRNYDFEGTNNNYIVGGFPQKDPYGSDLLPASSPFHGGAAPIPDVSEAPGRAGASGGHIWDAVRDAGLSFRNYGFFYAFGDNVNIPDSYPAAKGLQPAGHDLGGISDIDFKKYDNDYADSDAPAAYFMQTGDPNCLYPNKTFGHYNAPSRFSEFNRELQEMLAADPTGASVPNFVTARFHHDHTQGLSSGKHSPEAEVADNDYAVGEFVQAISQNKALWDSSAIFVIEDDAQAGPDHVDCHRSICFVASPFIKQGSVDHTFYNTDSVLKTMELLLGVLPMSQYDAVATPILDFDTAPNNDSVFNAIVPSKDLIADVNPSKFVLNPKGLRYKLAALSDKMDFVHPDSAPAGLLNQIIWKSVRGVSSRMPTPRHTLTEAQLHFGLPPTGLAKAAGGKGRRGDE